MATDGEGMKDRSNSIQSEQDPVELSWEYESAAVDELDSTEKEASILPVAVNPSAKLLCTGILEKFSPQALKAQKQLNELASNQRILIETLQQENRKFIEAEEMESSLKLFKQTREYVARLQAVVKQMHSITDRTAKMKKRAFRLRDQMERDRHQAQVERERQKEYDQKLQPVIRRPPQRDADPSHSRDNTEEVAGAEVEPSDNIESSSSTSHDDSKSNNP